MHIYEGNLHKKNGAISQLGDEKTTFPPKRGLHMDIRTDGRTFALLLKNQSLEAYNKNSNNLSFP